MTDANGSGVKWAWFARASVSILVSIIGFYLGWLGVELNRMENIVAGLNNSVASEALTKANDDAKVIAGILVLIKQVQDEQQRRTSTNATKEQVGILIETVAERLKALEHRLLVVEALARERGDLIPEMRGQIIELSHQITELQVRLNEYRRR